MKFTIKNEDIQDFNDSGNISFPKYTSQLMNWANQNAQGTRPKIVGQMSELFPEFLKSADEVSNDAWSRWYQEHYPDAIETAANKIYEQVKNLQKAIQLIDLDLVRQWVNDLIVAKTYNGLYVQKAILASLAARTGKKYRLAQPDEEAVGIDGYVGDTAYSIKPDTYKTMGRLPEAIDVKMIYYTKTKTGLTVEVDE